MKLTSSCFGDNQKIPVECAFCAPDPNSKTHVTLSKNLNPDLAWSGLPAGTRSLVLICHDRDVPSKADNVNREGRSIPASLPRIDFYRPCPPWNDTVIHHYVFTLYALDVATCPVQGSFKGPDAIKAIAGHVLESASLTGVYALNPAVSI